jgi:hypothetical protein
MGLPWRFPGTPLERRRGMPKSYRHDIERRSEVLIEGYKPLKLLGITTPTGVK